MINFFTSGVTDNKLFIFESIVVIVMSKTLKKTKVYNFQSIFRPLYGNTDQIACKYDTKRWMFFHPIARDIQGKSILKV